MSKKEDVNVYYSHIECEVTSVTNTLIECDLPKNSDSTAKIVAGTWIPNVHIKGLGFLKIGTNLVAKDYNVSITNIIPSSGSTEGGLPIII